MKYKESKFKFGYSEFEFEFTLILVFRLVPDTSPSISCINSGTQKIYIYKSSMNKLDLAMNKQWTVSKRKRTFS